ncbi:D-alanine--D-alanine ligase [Actinocorallia longicatena]|uniref:D-alanine--D-alanine ligase n=1 Tax=Actinocorallia longicatena TaxID=111803 RepID=A0ABP6QCS0_9ACTN
MERVIVLAGGMSYEREVSLSSGRRVADALKGAGLEVEIREADAGLLPVLVEDPPDLVFPVLHGAEGEDGAVREVLELLGVPYVGARPDACRLAWDKPTAKAVMRAAGLATPESVTLPKGVFHDLGASGVMAAVVEKLGLPLFVKPTRGGSALGASVVRHAGELPAALVGCFSYGDAALIEKFIDGVEVAVGVLEIDGTATALPAVEIVPLNERYDYTARYTAGQTEFVTPARLAPAAMDAALDTALRAHEALGLRHLSRSDLIIDRDGTPYLLEVNVAPGMTETSLLPLALHAAGIDITRVLSSA